MIDTGLGKEGKIRNATDFKRNSQDRHFPCQTREVNLPQAHQNLLRETAAAPESKTLSLHLS